MKVLLDILNSEKTNLGKLELVEQLEKNIKFNSNQLTSTPPIRLDLRKKIEILNLILNEIKTKPTWGKTQLKDLFLEKILNHS